MTVWSRYTHLSPAEREDEDRRDRYDFDVTELADEDLRDEILRLKDAAQVETVMPK